MRCGESKIPPIANCISDFQRGCYQPPPPTPTPPPPSSTFFDSLVIARYLLTAAFDIDTSPLCLHTQQLRTVTKATTFLLAHHVSPSPRSRHVSQSARYLAWPTVRQMRRQMPSMRFLRATHHTSTNLRRVFFRQLSEQVYCLRRRGNQ